MVMFVPSPTRYEISQYDGTNTESIAGAAEASGGAILVSPLSDEVVVFSSVDSTGYEFAGMLDSNTPWLIYCQSSSGPVGPDEKRIYVVADDGNGNPAGWEAG